MDRRLTEFIGRTGADPGLAQDLLQNKNWDIEAAVIAYHYLQTMNPATLAAVQKDAVSSARASMTAGGGSPGKPPLSKAVAVDMDSDINRKLRRGISKTTENMQLVNKARHLVLSDIKESSEDHSQHFIETPEFTFILPDLTVYSEDFRAFLEKELIETSTMVSLEQAGRLNWWAETGTCQRLWPMATSGDGNCLLHAASLGMWGFHDRLLTLRKALYVTLTHGDSKGELYRRWRYHQTQVNKQSGLVYSEDEWKEEWENLIKLSSAKPRLQHGSAHSCCHSPATNGLMQRETVEDNTDVFYESLEEFHVFVLAHVLQRPVIVVADIILKNSNGEALAPIPFGGIYLPLECNPEKCHRSPLVLTYDASHFSALVAMEQDSSSQDKSSSIAVIPLVDPDLKLLPLHFAVDPGINFMWKTSDTEQKTDDMQLIDDQKMHLLEKYLNIEKIFINKLSETPGHENTFTDGVLLEPRSRSNSNSGSYESDEGTNSTSSSENGGRSKEDKKSNRVTRQMQTVAKQFGSIGKSMSKKLKKNFGNIGKSLKMQNEQSSGRIERERKGSVGSVTQSTKVHASVVSEHWEILAAKLSHKRADYQEEMIANYLHAAQERFKIDRELKRQKGIELRQKAEERHSIENAPSQCINPGCEFKATAATSYLCSVCFDKEKAQALNFKRTPATGNEQYSDTVTIPEAQVRIALQRQTTVSNAGKSKFYTLPEECQCLPTPVTSQVMPAPSSPLNNNRPVQRNDNGLELSNSKFYTKHAKGISVPKNSNLPRGTVYINNDMSRSPKSQDVHSKTVNHTQLSTAAGRVSNSPSDSQNRHSSAQQRAVSGASHDLNEASTSGSSQVWQGGEVIRRQCKTHNCAFFGSEETDFLCSACYKQKQRTLAYLANSRQTRL